MARFNSVAQTLTASGTTVFSSPTAGLLTTLSGAAPYVVTLANPTLYTGQTQTFYNSTSGLVTLSTPGGNIIGPGSLGSSTLDIPSGAVFTLASNGTDYVLIDNNGGTISATSASFSSTVNISPTNSNVTISPTGTGTLTINCGTSGTINNVAIGNTTRGSGAFTTLAANNAVTFTLNTDATSASSGGSVTISGGLGVQGKIYAGSIQDTPVGSTTANSGAFTTLSTSSTTVFTDKLGIGSGITTPNDKLQIVGGGINLSDSAGSTRTFIRWQSGSTYGYTGLHLINMDNSSLVLGTNNSARAYIDVNGHFSPTTTNAYDLGTSSLRWRTIYTTDLELSNGIGDYTVVEGEEDLFLYNNKNGKTYKFMLSEVDPSIVPPKKAATPGE